MNKSQNIHLMSFLFKCSGGTDAKYQTYTSSKQLSGLLRILPRNKQKSALHIKSSFIIHDPPPKKMARASPSPASTEKHQVIVYQNGINCDWHAPTSRKVDRIEEEDEKEFFVTLKWVHSLMKQFFESWQKEEQGTL